VVTPRVVRIAVAGRLPGPLDYLVPPDWPELPATGARVLVPLARQRRCGIVLEQIPRSPVPSERLRPVLRQIDIDPILGKAHLEFLSWAAGYYQHPIGEVLFSALPKRLRECGPSREPGDPCWSLTDAGRSLAVGEPRRAPRQRELLALLRGGDGPMLESELLQCLGVARPQLQLLEQKGWIVASRRLPVPLPVEPAPAARELNAEQRLAVDQVRGRISEFATFLLDGVTGSGKTEVYLALIREVLAQQRNVLLLVPEIGLTPQLLTRVRGALGLPVAVLHSGLTDAEREREWESIRADRQRLVIGTRSAVLAPIPRLGLIVVDEEHDPSYKQQEGFRYHARDLALVRGQRAGCPVVLGSATPSLETLNGVDQGRVRYLRLRERASGGQPPKLELVDIRDQPLLSGLSQVLLREIGHTLAAGQQALVFLNRRGFAPVLTCKGCGWLSNCPRCDARQTWHKGSGILWCHHCGSQRPLPEACPDCGGELIPLGQGTERLEESLAGRFPEVPLIRVDRDATRRRGSLESLLQQAHSGQPALLIGTQMLAKGHDFPAIALAGLLDMDAGLYGADFRAGERMAQLAIQVAGRVGRGGEPGRVLLQTRFPEHPLYQALLRGGYPTFAQLALQERRLADLPPFSHQVLIRAEAAGAELPPEFLQEVTQQVVAQGAEGVAVWGPVPAPMARRAGRHRAHLLLQAPRRGPLQRLLVALLPWMQQSSRGRRVRWSVDVDPVDTY